MSELVPITEGRPTGRKPCAGKGEIVGIWHGVHDLARRWTEEVDRYCVLRDRAQMGDVLDFASIPMMQIYEAMEATDARIKFYTWCINCNIEEHLMNNGEMMEAQ